MQRKRGDEPPFGRPHPYIVRQIEKCIEPVGAADRGAESQEMQRQEDRQCDAGERVQKRGYKAVLEMGRPDHAAYTAKAARRPSASRMSEMASMAMSSERPRQFAHSRKMLRRPIGAWMDAAMTKTE